MFTTVREMNEAACDMLIKIRDGGMDFSSPGLPDPYYRYVVDYIIYEKFVTGLYGARTQEGGFIIGDPDSPRITRKGLAFIKRVQSGGK